MKHRLAWSVAGLVSIAVLGLTAFFYFTVIRPAASVMADLEQISELRPMNAGLWNDAPFTPPVDGNLTEDQVARFARVQAAMRIGMATDYPVLDERAQRLKGLTTDDEGEHRPRRLGIREAILAFRGLGPVLLRAKEIQVNALNTEQFSIAEYRWVREHVYRALGFSNTSVYIEEFAADLKETKRWDFAARDQEPAPSEVDRDLVSTQSESVDDWLPFLVFGF